MSISLNDLGPYARKQALDKLKAQADEKDIKAAKSKYHSQKTDIDGIKFDSKKEARRFITLSGLLMAGFIKDLRLQVNFTLQEAYTTPAGERVRAIVYRADFTYLERVNETSWVPVVEDVKSKATKTADYKLKRKMMNDIYGISIREV